ncbi:hypothetical protein PS880_05747 [Pseudomonas fluorescens]|uniref:Uncharacterized protein n=1 Tax=Pseudomonas fluorescens TaxID=294 RepID=A0A5E7Q4U2_PSEFL|nr:hypothetical protein PS880_05747 [Pseudomonas fluorescens]
MTTYQRSRRSIRRTRAIVGFLFLSIILLAPAIGGLITQ